MKFFVDTADVNEIKDLAETGLLDGVTTNPTLVAKTGRDFKTIIAEICEIVPGPVSAEVTATEVKEMLAEARTLAKIADNVTIKLPLMQCPTAPIAPGLTAGLASRWSRIAAVSSATMAFVTLLRAAIISVAWPGLLRS